MKLSREQRSRLLAGDYHPLDFTTKPECEKGTRYVLVRTRGKRAEDGAGGVYTVPSEPSLWIVVTTVTKVLVGTKWRWTVRFVVHDHRSRSLYLHKDSSRGYTTDPRLAMRGERAAAVDAKTMERYSLEAKERDKLHKAQEAAKRDAELMLWQRLKRLEEDAAKGLDVGRQLGQIRSRVEAAERKKQRRAA